MIYQNPPSPKFELGSGLKKYLRFEPGNTYQPIRMLSYAIDYKIWGLNPLGYHITNILFYILTCIMVFFTLRLLSAELREGSLSGLSWTGCHFWSTSFCRPPRARRSCHLACGQKRSPSRILLLPWILSLPQGKQGDRTKSLLLLPKSSGPFHSFGHSFKTFCSYLPRGYCCV